MKFSLSAAALAAVAFATLTTAQANIVTHFGQGIGSDVPDLLDAVGIGSTNAASENVATTFFVPFSGSVSLEFTFQRDTGSFLYSFGFYDVAAVTADPTVDQELYATQALAAAVEVFDNRMVGIGATSDKVVTGGTELGFYLIPNNTLAGFNADPSAFFPSRTNPTSLRAPLFSVTAANPGGLDQMLSFGANNTTLFTFEDLTRTAFSDNDFTDLAFTVVPELIPATIIPEPSAAALLVLPALALVVWIRRRR